MAFCSMPRHYNNTYTLNTVMDGCNREVQILQGAAIVLLLQCLQD